MKKFPVEEALKFKKSTGLFPKEFEELYNVELYLWSMVLREKDYEPHKKYVLVSARSELRKVGGQRIAVKMPEIFLEDLEAEMQTKEEAGIVVLGRGLCGFRPVAFLDLYGILHVAHFYHYRRSHPKVVKLIEKYAKGELKEMLLSKCLENTRKEIADIEKYKEEIEKRFREFIALEELKTKQLVEVIKQERKRSV